MLGGVSDIMYQVRSDAAAVAARVCSEAPGGCCKGRARLAPRAAPARSASSAEAELVAQLRAQTHIRVLSTSTRDRTTLQNRGTAYDRLSVHCVVPCRCGYLR